MRYQLRLLLSGFIVSFLVVVALAALSFFRIHRLDARISQVEHTYTVINTINLLNDGLQEMNRTSFRYATGGDTAFLERFNETEQRWNTFCDSLKRLTSDNPSQQASITMLRSDMSIYRAKSEHVMDSAPRLPTELMLSEPYLTRRQNADSQTARLLHMKGLEFDLLRKRTDARKEYLELTSSLIRTLTLVFGLLTSVLFIFLLHEFRRRITYQTELQQKVAEIAQSKRELEHIAYATSHDLQEPLRKIRILTDRWQSRHQDALDAESKALMERIIGSAARMQDLVSELMILASLNDEKQRVACPLRQYAEAVIHDFAGVISAKDAGLHIDPLPVVLGYPDQLKLLFRNLLDNALKFSNPDAPLRISITSRAANGSELAADNDADYQCVIIEDNGLGFDNRQADKMFGIFRQLHGAGEGYTGKGTGLAICQRIMHNHRGTIVAHGFPGEGATFKLYFPVK